MRLFGILLVLAGLAIVAFVATDPATNQLWLGLLAGGATVTGLALVESGKPVWYIAGEAFVYITIVYFVIMILVF